MGLPLIWAFQPFNAFVLAAATGPAWLLARQPWIAPIPGTRRLERLDENLGAVGLVLTPDDIAELDEASASVQVQGERYPERLQRMIDR